MRLFKQHRPSVLASCVLAALVAPVASIAYAATAVNGYVYNADGAPLEGVKVTVKGTAHSVFTDSTGRYHLRQLNQGAQTLVFEYIGLPEKEVTVQVSAEAQQVNMQLGTESSIERIQVTSQQEASNRALNEYRAADAITNFIAADDMGQFVDQNVAESLQRIPGTTLARDQGEGRFVSIRGISPGLNTVTLNGVRIGTPEDSSRAVALDVIPTGSVESISLVKAPTADMPGDALGGAIDVKSPSPFDRKGGQVRYRAEGSYNELSGSTSPKLQFNASDVLNEQFGYAFGLNYQDRELESDNLEAEYDEVDFGADEVFSMIELQQRKYYVARERTGANVNLEYRPSANSRLFFNTIYSEFVDAETRQRSIFSFEDGDLLEFTGTSGRADLPADSIKRRIRFRTKEQDTLAMNLGGEHHFQAWSLDYHVGYSKTRERVLDENEGRYEYQHDDLTAAFAFGDGLPSFALYEGDQLSQRHLDNANFVLDRAVLEPKIIDDDDYAFGFNAEIPVAFGIPSLTLKTGVDVRMKEKMADVAELELRDVPAALLSEITSAMPDYSLGTLGDGISSADYIAYYQANRDLFKERGKDVDENRALSEGQDYSADEDVYAAYLMGTFDFDATRVIAGVRVEQTKFDASGTEILFDEEGELIVGERFAKTDYTNVLPSLHVVHDLSEDLKLRAAWTNTIARPSFGDLSPRAEINLEDQEVELGNPELEPYEAMNWDMMLDWYYAPSSVLSAGVFYKDIDNYVVDTVSRDVAGFEGFEVERPTNAISASVKGFEANWQHSVMDGSLEGVLFGANLTLLDTELALLEREGESFSIPESADTTGNLFIGYERGPLSTRLSVTYRDTSLNEVGDDARYDIYTAAHTQVDLTASYRFSKQLELVVEGTNLNDEPLELYQGSKGHTLQHEVYGRTFSIGVKGRF
ncbi:TonB-dependent receptor [Pseudidiomarina sediminum]|uniref:TonB-dependent receptor n=1 Tax=Pseudidiomarina sediminum TaxID=431675 RepID=A0A432Z2P4_9GAMM|nr:TonB-dependent receptor [Pseudidiomarina sediminum]RUO72166.1 TonB-dependent receptor [Pseudidiomarina sediminum]